MIGDIEALNEEMERLRRKGHLLESLMRLAQLPDVDESDVRDEALDIVAELTDSEAAFLYTFNADDGTLESGVWSGATERTGGRIVIKDAGAWAKAAESAEMLVSGEGPLDSSAILGLGFRGGVRRFVSTPVSAQGEVVAVAGVLNKPTPYSEEDRRRVSMLMHSMWAILDHKKAQRLLRGFAYDDALTGLANRHRFEQVLRIEVRRADRAGVSLGLVVADLDDFAAFNAVQGRGEGDEALRRAGGALRDAFQRAGEVCARLGDDLFAMVLPATDGADAQRAGERARETVESLGIAHPSSDTADRLTVSVGIAVHEPRSGLSSEALLNVAMEGLDQSRKAGGNLVGSRLPDPGADIVE